MKCMNLHQEKDIEQIIIDKENVTDDIQPKMVLKEKKESKDSKPA